MGKILSIIRGISNCVEKDVKSSPLYLNDRNSIDQETYDNISVKTHIYIPSYLNRINKVVSIVSFVLYSKKIAFSNNQMLSAVSYGVLVRYLDDYLSEQTYFSNFKSYVCKETEKNFRIGTVNAVKNFTVMTGRYVEANVVLSLN